MPTLFQIVPCKMEHRNVYRTQKFHIQYRSITLREISPFPLVGCIAIGMRPDINALVRDLSVRADCICHRGTPTYVLSLLFSLLFLFFISPLILHGRLDSRGHLSHAADPSRRINRGISERRGQCQRATRRLDATELCAERCAGSARGEDDRSLHPGVGKVLRRRQLIAPLSLFTNVARDF